MITIQHYTVAPHQMFILHASYLKWIELPSSAGRFENENEVFLEHSEFGSIGRKRHGRHLIRESERDGYGYL